MIIIIIIIITIISINIIITGIITVTSLSLLFLSSSPLLMIKIMTVLSFITIINNTFWRDEWYSRLCHAIKL